MRSPETNSPGMALPGKEESPRFTRPAQSEQSEQPTKSEQSEQSAKSSRPEQSARPTRRVRPRRVFSVVGFCTIALALFTAFGNFFQPFWFDTNVSEKTQSFYREPENKLEILFFGASITGFGIDPMQLYEDEGLCAFSYGTGGQPPLASYYLAQEAQRLHPDSLKTIVLDASLLRSILPTQRYQQVFDTIPLNATKVEAVSTYANLEDDEATGVKAGFHRVNNTISYLFPLLEYHSRWAEIQKLDYKKGEFPDQDYLRGFVLYTSRYLDNGNYDSQKTPEYVLDTNAVPTKFPDEPVEYFNKLADFCEEKDIRLVLMKTPTSNWSSADSLAARQLAQERGIEFLDFNFGDLLDGLDYNRALDSVDGVHLNKWGAAKLTRSIGRYLVEECGAADRRDDPDYAYMDELLSEYKEVALDPVRLSEADDVCDYLDFAMDQNADYSVLVTVQGDGATAITPVQRRRLRVLGLDALADLAPGQGYVALANGRDVVVEETGDRGIGAISEGTLPGGTVFDLSSNVPGSRVTASCVIDEIEYSKNQPGINVVVYDNAFERVIDTANFATGMEATRTVDLEEALTKALALGTVPEQLPERLKRLYDYEQADAAAREAAATREAAAGGTT